MGTLLCLVTAARVRFTPFFLSDNPLEVAAIYVSVIASVASVRESFGSPLFFGLASAAKAAAGNKAAMQR
jgi:hypothetical protein